MVGNSEYRWGLRRGTLLCAGKPHNYLVNIFFATFISKVTGWH